jgi:hypothetical protein
VGKNTHLNLSSNEQKSVADLQHALEAKKIAALKAVRASRPTSAPSPTVSGVKAAATAATAKTSPSVIPRPKTASPAAAAKAGAKESPSAIPRPTMSRADVAKLKSLNAHTEMFVQRGSNLQVWMLDMPDMWGWF